ncbi:unnamed protein product, partial [marine sediment metagenome]
MKKPFLNLEDVLESVASRLTEVSIDSGNATGGLLTEIEDTTKDWELSKWKNAIVEVEVDGVHYYRTVSDNTKDTLTIITLPGGHPVAAGDHYNIRLSTRIVTISGQVVQVSGQPVKVSGQTVVAEVSGQIVNVSGAHVFVESGAVVLVSGQPVVAEVDLSGKMVTVSGQ